MNKAQKVQLLDYLQEVDNLEHPVEILRWSKRVAMFLRTAMGSDVSDGFRTIGAEDDFDALAMRRGHLEGLIAQSEEESNSPILAASSEVIVGKAAPMTSTKKVFVVHGHDGEVKETVARFLTRLELDPIILHEQASQGRSLIEKFETSSTDVAFAVVLLTPDDFGRAAARPPELHPRARQNVILELGYFLGRLGRTRVCALHKGGVELPSDFQGVVYIPFDAAGAWKTLLAQELLGAKLTIRLEDLING
jgi:predicted nucleotide-binding protein